MRSALMASVVWLAAATSTHAAFIWSPPAGTTSNFSYANGLDFNGDLKTPTVDGSGFAFIPTTYASTAINGSTGDTSDTAVVDVTASPGKTLKSISASIVGDYTVFGTGSVNAIGALAAMNLDAPFTVLALPMTFTGTPATTITSTDGNFSGIVTITLPAGWTRAELSFPSTISTTAGAGSSALIQVKDADLTVVTAVPEPALAAGLGSLALVIRRGAIRRPREGAGR